MALSNSERQARYRSALKQRSKMLDGLLAQTRTHIREWQRSIALFGEGQMRIHSNNVDVSAEHVQNLHHWIEENAAILQRYDPENETADGDLELGDIAPCRPSQLWRGRPVTFELDKDGRARALHVFNDEGEAGASASSTTGLHVGTVGAQAWSITPTASVITSDAMYWLLVSVSRQTPVDPVRYAEVLNQASLRGFVSSAHSPKLTLAGAEQLVAERAERERVGREVKHDPLA